MGYRKIKNLYADKSILEFKRGYAMEKVHGTSAHLTFRKTPETEEIWCCYDCQGTSIHLSVDFPYCKDCLSQAVESIKASKPAKLEVKFFSGGEKYDNFVKLFDIDKLKQLYLDSGIQNTITIYGEAYGGRCQGMSATYGKELAFIAFEVEIGGSWLDVPTAEKVVTSFGLEFVPYWETPLTLEALDKLRDQPSVVAQRRGCGDDKLAEGIVIRPPFEVTLNNGERLLAKHKRAEFSEHSKPRKAGEALKAESDADLVAADWVNPMRLGHVLDKNPIKGMPEIKLLISAMIEDIRAESEGEIVWSKAVERAIGKQTVAVYKSYLNQG